MVNQRSLLATASDILALSHIFNAISSAATVMIGFLVTAWAHNEPIQMLPFFGASLATLLISSGGFVINDILDIEIDRINRPDRALASGQVSIPVAWALYVLYTALGILITFATTTFTAGILSIVIAAALGLYSYWLKRQFLIGHLTIAILGALLLPFGGLAEGHLLPSIVIVPMVMLAFLAREILKTVPDVEGDRANGVINIATRYSPALALRLSKAILLVAALLLPLVPLLWTLNVWYVVVVVALIWPLVIYASFWKEDSLIRLSKMIFLLVAVALLVGSIR